VPCAALHAGTVVTGVASPETKDAVIVAERLAADRFRQQEVHADFLARLAEDARQYADENDLCGHFDDFMEKWGFQRREQEYEVRIDFDPVYVTVMAASQEDAQNAVDAAAVTEALPSGPLPEWSGSAL